MTRKDHTLKCIQELLERTLDHGTLDKASQVDLESALEYCKTGKPKVVDHDSQV